MNEMESPRDEIYTNLEKRILIVLLERGPLRAEAISVRLDPPMENQRERAEVEDALIELRKKRVVDFGGQPPVDWQKMVPVIYDPKGTELARRFKVEMENQKREESLSFSLGRLVDELVTAAKAARTEFFEFKQNVSTGGSLGTFTGAEFPGKASQRVNMEWSEYSDLEKKRLVAFVGASSSGGRLLPKAFEKVERELAAPMRRPSSTKPHQSKTEIVRLLQQVLSDFDRMRHESGSIRLSLLHMASNAGAEGVTGIPSSNAGLVGTGSAGRRMPRQRIDGMGYPKFRDDPILDATGRPIVNSAGDFFDFVIPVTRTIRFFGDPVEAQRVRDLASRGGTLISALGTLPAFPTLEGWEFDKPEDRWWAIVFELAWTDHHPLLRAQRRIWLPAPTPNTFLPWDIDQLRRLAESPIGPAESIPKNWLMRLPDAYVSELDNAAAASFDAADAVLAQLHDGHNAPEIPHPDKRSRIKPAQDATPKLENATQSKRFRVAFSFAGEKRDYVKKVAAKLAKKFGEKAILYDKYHEAEFARSDLGTYLPELYNKQASLVVVVLCKDYGTKDWCGLEWTAIHDLIKQRKIDQLMLTRFDRAITTGVFSSAGWVELDGKSANETTKLVLERLALNEGKATDHYYARSTKSGQRQ